MKRTLVLLLALLLALPVHAGSATDPEVTDPAGDLSRSEGALVGSGVEQEPFADVDLLAAWLDDDGTGLTISVQSAGDVTESTVINATFRLAKGPDSLAGSTADNSTISMQATGATLDNGPDGTTVAQAGNLTTFTVPLAAIGATGGDLVRELVITSSNSDAGALAVTADDQSATDRAPDEGTTSRDYMLSRPPVDVDVDLTVTGGRIGDAGFTGATATTSDGDAKILFEITVALNGTDADKVELSVGDPGAGATATLGKSSVDLNPGESSKVILTVDLSGFTGTTTFDVAATSARGATDSVAVTVTFSATTTTTTGTTTGTTTTTTQDSREPILDVGFLTTMAEAMGFDEAFGDAAEIAVLALFVLLVLVVVVLLLFLASSKWITVRVQPTKAGAAPGEKAEYQILIHNRKKYAFQARLHFDLDDEVWRTGVLLSQSEGATLDPLTSTDQELEFTLNGKKDPGNHYVGTVRVKVPVDAADGERNRTTVTVTPIDADGHEKTNKSRRARMTTRADHSMIVPVDEPRPNVRLKRVEHDPVDPAPGEEVETSVTIENDDDSRTWVLRVALIVDGEQLQEQVVAVPPHKGRAVIFTWRAPSEASNVKVAVFEKTKGDEIR